MITIKFEILRSGQVVFWTETQSCVPDTETLQGMKAAGYTFKLDGKRWLPPTAKKSKTA